MSSTSERLQIERLQAELKAARRIITAVNYADGNRLKRSWVREALISRHWYSQAMDPVERQAYGYVLDELSDAQADYDAIRVDTEDGGAT